MGFTDTEQIQDKSFCNILLWLPNWIGDVVLTLPSVQTIRKRYPYSRITLIAKPPADRLLNGHPAVDTILKAPTGNLIEQIRFARGLQKYHFDLAAIFTNSFRGALMTLFSGAKVRLGYATDARSILLTHPLHGSPRSKTEHRVDYFFKLLSPLNLPDLDQGFNQFISEQVDRSLAPYLDKLRADYYDFTITLHPGGSKPERRWHAERFGILCQKLIKKHGAKVFILGGPGDKELINSITRICPTQSSIGCTDLNLQQITALIRRTKLFIGNDSGLMHLAAIAGTPIIGIFGPGNPATTGPYIEKEKQVWVTKNYSCSPCKQRFFYECDPSPHQKPYCIEDISIMDVEDAVHKMIRLGVIKV